MNPSANRRILIADDNPAIHEDFRKIFAPNRARGPGAENAVAAQVADVFEIESAMQGHEAYEKLKHAVKEGRPFAMAFVDVRMPPGWDGIATISHLWKADPTLQVALCTAYSDYSWEKLTADLGATEKLVILKKPFDNVEVLQLARTLTSKWDATREVQRQVAELDRRVGQRTQHLRAANEELRRTEERYAKVFNAVPVGLAIQALNDGCFIEVNDTFAELAGVPRGELIGRTPHEVRVLLDFPPAALDHLRAGRPVHRAETHIGTPGGEVRHALVSCDRIALGGEPHLLLLAQDISKPAQPAAHTSRCTYTILLAEDDAAVRSHVREVLTHHAYRVLEAANARAAIEVWRDQRESIDLLLTDMVMPGSGNGLDLARRFLSESPNLKVIYTSGYGTERFADDVELEEGRNYLPKPYLSDKLINVLRNALEPAVAG